MSQKQKTILVPVPRNTSIGAKTHCIGASVDGVCRERGGCALHLRQLADPSETAMRIGRVGLHACHYRVEVTA